MLAILLTLVNLTFTVPQYLPAQGECRADTVAKAFDYSISHAVVFTERLGKPSIGATIIRVAGKQGQRVSVLVDLPERGWLYRITVACVDSAGNQACPSNTVFKYSW